MISNRKFIKEGQTIIIKKGKQKNRYSILFHNLLLICIEKKNSNKNQSLKIKDKYLIPETLKITILTKDFTKNEFLFEIELEKKKKLIFFFVNKEEYTSWLSNFQDIIDSFITYKQNRSYSTVKF